MSQMATINEAALKREPDLIIFGGSFDPPHQGHIDCVKEAIKRFPLAEFWIIPAKSPAGAGGQHKSPSASFDDRMDLCKTAFLALGQSGQVKILPIEKDLPEPNYTLNTLEKIKREMPNKRLGFLLGQDQITSFPRWREPLKIMGLADLVVVRRDHVDKGYGGNLTDTVQKLAVALNLSCDWYRSRQQAFFTDLDSSVFVINKAISLAESNMIKNFIQKNSSLPADWEPPAILEFIRARGLYRK